MRKILILVSFLLSNLSNASAIKNNYLDPKLYSDTVSPDSTIKPIDSCNQNKYKYSVQSIKSCNKKLARIEKRYIKKYLSLSTEFKNALYEIDWRLSDYIFKYNNELQPLQEDTHSGLNTKPTIQTRKIKWLNDLLIATCKDDKSTVLSAELKTRKQRNDYLQSIIRSKKMQLKSATGKYTSLTGLNLKFERLNYYHLQETGYALKELEEKHKRLNPNSYRNKQLENLKLKPKQEVQSAVSASTKKPLEDFKTQVKSINPNEQSLTENQSLAYTLPFQNESIQNNEMSGLQTNVSVKDAMQKSIEELGPNAKELVAERMGVMQEQMGLLRYRSWMNSIAQVPSVSNAADIPTFKINPFKGKPIKERFTKRLSLQFNPAPVNKNIPDVTVPMGMDIGLQAGYMVIVRMETGLSGNYKIGFGKSINDWGLSYPGYGYSTYVRYGLTKMWSAWGEYGVNYFRMESAGLEFGRGKFIEKRSAIAGFCMMSPGTNGSKKQNGKNLKNKMRKSPGYGMMIGYDFLSGEKLPRSSGFVVRSFVGF